MTDSELRDWIRFRLEALRNGSGMPANVIAKKAGMSEEHIFKLERGGSFPTVRMLNKLLAAYGINLGVFFAPLVSAHERKLSKEDQAAHDALDYALADPKRAAGVRLMMASFWAGKRQGRSRKDS